jgi:DNA replication protein DnaC
MKDLYEQLKELRLPGIIEGLPSRLTQAREQALPHQDWLRLLLQDELERRHQQGLQKRLHQATFEGDQTLETYDLALYPVPLQHLIKELQKGDYVKEYHHVLVMGPTGTGKSHLAQGLGHQACRQGKKVKFIRAKKLFEGFEAHRLLHPTLPASKRLHPFLQPDILILDDFGLNPLTLNQAEDFYELIAEKHQKSSFIMTSNRPVEAWVDLFPDPVMGNAALDRLAHCAYHVILEGDSHRRKTHPHLRFSKPPSPSRLSPIAGGVQNKLKNQTEP